LDFDLRLGFGTGFAASTPNSASGFLGDLPNRCGYDF
jgi:hypothetical protein